MAKPTRGGLGRGLNSLLNEGSESSDIKNRTKNRDRVIYNEREDVVIDSNGNQTPVDDFVSPAVTGKIAPIGNPRENVSRETSTAISQENPIKTRVVDAENTAEKPKIMENIQQKPSGETKAVNEKPEEIEITSSKSIKDIKNLNNVILDVDIEKVQPNPEQPRTNFKEEDLQELSNSIKRHGLIQPILVRQLADGSYQIIAGERRWQASKLAGKDTVQVQVRDVDDEKALEFALIENIQRTDLNPIEEAYGYRRLMERNKMTQADIAQTVSKGRSTIANSLRLLELPEEAQQLLYEDKITAGHARAILSVPTREDKQNLTQKIIDKGMTVRETEALARLMSNKPSKKEPREPQPAIYKSVARALKTSLGAPVKIKTNKGKNKIEIEFTDEEDLERLFDLINPS